MPYFLGLKAEALYLAYRTSEALEAIEDAEALAERSEERWWCAELHRLRAVFLATLGADETQIEASFCAAIRMAKEQKSISLQKRAEATYAEYRRQKANASGGRGFRLPLWYELPDNSNLVIIGSAVGDGTNEHGDEARRGAVALKGPVPFDMFKLTRTRKKPE